MARAATEGAEIGLGVSPDGPRLTVELVLEDGEGDKICAPLTYVLDSEEGIVPLALAVLGRSVRVEFFELVEDRELELLRTVHLDLNEPTLSTLRDSALAAIGRLRLDDGSLPPLSIGNDWRAAFLATDRAKSDDLLIAEDVRALADGEASVASKYARVRLALLLDRAAAAEGGQATRDPSLEVAYQVALEEVRGVIRRRRPGEATEEKLDRDLQSLTAGVLPEGRCFVHLVIQEGYLQAFAAFGRQGGPPEVVRADLSHIDLGAIAALCSAWVTSDAEDALLELLDACHPLGTDLARLLLTHRAREVMLSPTAFLRAVPFHCLDGLDAVKLSYAPSVRAVKCLSELGAVGLGPGLCIGVDAGGIPAAELEAEAVSGLWGGRGLYRGPDATRGVVLALSTLGSPFMHFACHAAWVGGDHMSSFLELGRGERLSMAGVHAEADLTRVGLVVLSACSTGREFRGSRVVERWSGMDEAFLARGARAVAATMWPVADTVGFAYGVLLHAGLVRGEALFAAHALAVEAMRNGNVEALDDGHVRCVVEDVWPDYRAALSNADAAMRSPTGWGTFRLSGDPALVRGLSDGEAE